MSDKDSIRVSDGTGTTTSILKQINAFDVVDTRGEPNNRTLIYEFDNSELGHAHREEECNNSFRVVVDHETAPEYGNDLPCEFRLELTDPDREVIKDRSIIYGSDEHYSLKTAAKTVKSQIWTWAVWLRENSHHPARDALEELGVVNQHPPGEMPHLPDEWHYSTRVSQDTITSDSDNGKSRKKRKTSTRIEFKHSTESGSWHCATLTISFNHSPYDTRDVDDDEVCRLYIYITYNPIIPVDERVNQHDTIDIVRESVVHDSANTSCSIENLVETVENAMGEIEENAEALDDDHRLEIIKEAEKRWDPDTETYRDQSNITAW